MIAQASSHRPIPAQQRDDLHIVEQVHRGEKQIVVGDKLSLQFYYLNEQEYFLLQSLDGKRSMQQIKARFEARFTPYRIRYDEIQNYLIDFHQKSLVAIPASRRGQHLFRLARKQMVRNRISSFRNFLFLKFRGVNPDGFLRAITPLTSWFFSRTAVLLNVVFMACALLWLGTHYAEFARRLPSMQEFFSSGNLLLLLLTLTLLKICHELGHGIVFSKYGGRCHDLGVMLLVFVPTLYVNTSDSWRIKDRWKRAAIAAAGVYVELFLASVATFCWWFSRPGTFQYSCLNVMFLGSVSAVLFNGNPLLKFDGYYLLSDLLEIPNLQQRSQRLFRNWFLSRCLGIPTGDEHLLVPSTKRWLAAYVVLAFLYRILLLFIIGIMLVGVFRPVGLAPAAKILALALILSLPYQPILSIMRFLLTPGNSSRLEVGRTRLTGLCLSLCLAVVLLLPIPDYVVCPCTIQPSDSQTLYAPYESKLRQVYVQANQMVHKGDPIAALRNIDVELEIAQLEGELLELSTEQQLLRLMRHANPLGDAQLSQLQDQYTTTAHRLAELKKIQHSLMLYAPRDGIVIPNWKSEMPVDDPDALDGWAGSTLQDENRNALLQRGQAVCKIGKLTHLEAQLVIDQVDIESVNLGQDVTLLIDSYTQSPLSSRVASISKSDSEEVASTLARRFGGVVETRDSRASQVQEIRDPQNTTSANATYQAVVPLPKSSIPFGDNIRGIAKISTGNRTIASQLYRFLRKTFVFDM